MLTIYFLHVCVFMLTDVHVCTSVCIYVCVGVSVFMYIGVHARMVKCVYVYVVSVFLCLVT